MKKLIYILLLFFSFVCKAQDTQAQIDSIMTLYPNCTDYPTEVLIVLDSLLVALENEQNNNEANGEVDLLFLNYLSDNYTNMVVNGVIDTEQASLITDLNLDGLGLNNIDGIEYFTNLESLSCKNNNLTSIPDLPNQLETLNLRSNNISQISPLPQSVLDVDLRNNSLVTVPEFPNQIQTLKLCFNNFSNIPNLPDSLRVLYFAYNNLVGLPTLPSSTEQVLCYNNQIEYIEFIPESIEIFRVQNNNIIILPDIPSGIQTLDVSNNPIECVNSFPIHLEELMVYPTCVEGCLDTVALNYDINAHINNNSCEYAEAIVWPSSSEEINTGANATYLLENVSFNGEYVSEGFTLGAFYINDFGALSCGGISHWDGGPSSISVYINDETTNEKDGFDTGDQIIWLAYDPLSDSNYRASLNYISGSDIYAVNAINLVSDYTILNTPISVYGCTNEYALNYNTAALLNDASCIFTTNIELYDSITYLLNIIDSISITNSVVSVSFLENALEAWDFGINLVQGWNMFGYGCPQSKELTEVLSEYVVHVVIVKDNNGLAYLPEWNFNGIGALSPGYGYQIKVTESIDDFKLCNWYFDDILGD
ncbi:MAG: hypothetical protein CND86_04905 [Bacteroidetes bacterium MED-G21]|nr:MAG: hypothetical protein CND86_04905 [Bacteroidetes bacterium MED-G21]